jgi:hypothetical protein
MKDQGPHGDHRQHTGLTARPRLTRTDFNEIAGRHRQGHPLTSTEVNRLLEEVEAIWEWQDQVLGAMKALGEGQQAQGDGAAKEHRARSSLEVLFNHP